MWMLILPAPDDDHTELRAGQPNCAKHLSFPFHHALPNQKTGFNTIKIKRVAKPHHQAMDRKDVASLSNDDFNICITQVKEKWQPD
jgi:hypothetical protein